MPARILRILSVVDAFARESLALKVDTGLASRKVTCVLDEMIAKCGLPQAIRCDNGSQLTSRYVLAWGPEWKIELRHIQPSSPMQNGHVESFNGKLRAECLRASWFRNLFDAKVKIAAWRKKYNVVRPHSSLDYSPPDEFAAALRKASYGKDAGFACLGDADGVSRFPTAPATMLKS